MASVAIAEDVATSNFDFEIHHIYFFDFIIGIFKAKIVYSETKRKNMMEIFQFVSNTIIISTKNVSTSKRAAL